MIHDANLPGSGTIEQRSTSPHRGPGAYYRNNQLEGQSLFVGKIDDIYPVSGCCLVSVYGLQTSVPAVMLSHALGNYFGARDCRIPALGTEVLVYVGLDQKIGFIVGYVPTSTTTALNQPAGQIAVEGGVNSYSEKEAFYQGDWNKGKNLPQAGGGATVDALPGDDGVINDLGVFVGVLRAVALFRGSELAQVRAFAFDDVLEVIGHNLNVFTSQGETRVFSDCGRISSERLMAMTVDESLGAPAANQDAFKDNPNASLRSTPEQCSVQEGASNQVGKWRWKEWAGWLGDFFQSFVCRPAQGPGSLDTASQPDMGLSQEVITLSGERLQRSVLGVGLHKTLQVAVPKKAHEWDDPSGDQTVSPPQQKKPFAFDADHPMGLGAQSRDYFAHLFNKLIPTNRATLTKDWVTPDESSCPAPGPAPTVPGLGDFFREFPPEADTMAAGSGIPDDTSLGSSKFRVGEAYVGPMPDGSILIRDAWGSQIELRAGHIIASCSHDINLVAGRDVVHLAGNDLILKGRGYADLTATKGQVRIKAEQDVLVTSNQAGIVLYSPTTNTDLKTNERGEAFRFAGIILKSATGAVIDANEVDVYATQAVRIKDSPENQGQYPDILFHCNRHLQQVEQGLVLYKMDDDYIALLQGNLFVTKNIQAEKDIIAKEDVLYGGDSSNVDADKLPPSIADTMAGVITGSTFDSQIYTNSQIKPLIFTFRSTAEYGTQNGKWYQALWQSTLQGLDSWQENNIQGTYPWPGEANYDGGECLFTYKEVNVAPSGKPKSRGSQSDQPGDFQSSDFGSLKVQTS